MKCKITTLRAATALIIAILSMQARFGLQAQTTQVSWNFDDGNTSFAIINAVPEDPSYALSVNEGILKVDVSKKVNDYSFLQQFNLGLDLSSLPSLQFETRSEGGATISFTLKDTNDETIKVAHSPTTDTEMEYIYLDLGGKIDANPAFNVASIKEFQVEISNGWTVETNDVVYFDNIRLGFTEQLDAGGDYFSEDFEQGLPPEITDDTKYTPSAVDGALKVDVHKQDRWQPMDIGLGAVYDFSANPVVELRVRTDDPMVLQCFLVDEDGNGFRNEFIDAQYDHYELVDGENVFRQAKLLPDDDFTLLTFDFEGADPGIVDLSRIMMIRFCVNGTAADFTGTLYIDHIEAGTGVEKKAYIGQIDHVSVYKNRSGEQQLLIPEVRNAGTVAASGAEGLVNNMTVDAVTYSNVTENGYPQTYGYTHLRYELVDGATGTDTITLSAIGSGSYGDATEKFAITVADNMNPTIDQPGDFNGETGIENRVILSGLSDGDADAEQDLIFSLTSDNESVISAGTFSYTKGYQTAALLVTPLSEGEAHLTVNVEDEDGGAASATFLFHAYGSLNGVPAADRPDRYSFVNNSGENTVHLAGITDGDGMTQELAITATSSNNSVLPDPVVTYTQGDTMATLSLTPVEGETGEVTVTVSITDNGGNANNNGDQTFTMQFNVSVIAPSLSGYTINLEDPDVLGLFGASGTYSLSVVDFEGEKVLRIEMNNKSTWDGIVLHHPELNLVEAPMVSYDVYTLTADPTLYHWNYFYDVNSERNILNTDDHKYEAPVGAWTTLAFDYRQEGDMSTSGGVPIDASRIDYLLLNMHSTLVGWPFTEINGVCYLKNIRLGDHADIPEPPVFATIGDVPEQAVFVDAGEVSIQVRGITNGMGSTEGVTVSGESTNTDVVSDPTLGEVSEDGVMELRFTPLEVGYADITLTVHAEGAEPGSTKFRVRIMPTEASEHSSIMVDRSVKHQTIKGIGAFYNEPRWTDMFVEDMGASAVRLGIISNQWEPVNDNDDPEVMNMEGFNYDAFDWQYMRDLKAAGVEHFILTSWSPPAWMKRSLTTNHTNQAIEWEKTDNILEPYYYEEFAESMAAVAKAFKEKADIDLLAIGLQNEPFFNEPYASAILGPDQFHKLIEVVGDRFSREGLDHVGFYMPEQVFGFFHYTTEDYVASLRTNEKADAYTDYVGVHGYDGSGVDSDFPSYEGWSALFDYVSGGSNPKELWMTETHIGYNNFNSAMDLAGAIHGSLWAGNITLWTNWGFGDVQLTRNEPNSSFYATKQFSRYIRPGAVRVDSESDHARLLVTAFENEDDSFVMVVLNTGHMPVSARFSGSGLPENYQVIRTSRYENALDAGTFTLSEGPCILPASSVTTFISTDVITLTMLRPDDVTVNSTDGEQQLLITGISNGAGGVDNLVLDYEIEGPGIIAESSISGISGDGTATFTFTPEVQGDGQAKVYLSLSDDQGNIKTDVFFITVNLVEGIGEMEGKRMRVYPNPASDMLHVELPAREFEQISLKDISGKTVYEFIPDGDQFVIDISALRPGIYIIEAKGETGRMIERVVVE